MMAPPNPSPAPAAAAARSATDRVLVPLALVVLPWTSPAGAQPPTERVEHTVEVTGNPVVRVMNFAGHVDIHGTDPGEHRILRVVGVKRLEQDLPAEEAARLFERINLALRRHGRRIEVNPYGRRPPAGTHRRRQKSGPEVPLTEIRPPRQIPPVSVDLELWLPEGLSLEVHTFSAPVTVSGISAPEGHFRLRSISGALTVSQVEGREVRAETVSGDLRARDVLSHRSLFKTLTAGIRMDGIFDPEGWYEIQTHSGAAVLGLGAVPGFAVDATSYTGAIVNELELEGEADAHHLAGRRGPEGPHILVNTFSGQILLTHEAGPGRRETQDR